LYPLRNSDPSPAFSCPRSRPRGFNHGRMWWMVETAFRGKKFMGKSPSRSPARIVREKRTVAAMVDIYCHAHHGTADTLCSECSLLLEYARCRLDRCPFGAAKTPCAKCPTHCFQPLMRTRIKAVMRYAGPRMLLRHPILAMLHQWDSLVKKTKRKRNGVK
jgi:hypothetical protein